MGIKPLMMENEADNVSKIVVKPPRLFTIPLGRLGKVDYHSKQNVSICFHFTPIQIATYGKRP